MAALDALLVSLRAIGAGNYLMTAVMALGIAVLFFTADRRSPSTRAFSLALAFSGIAIMCRLITLHLDKVGGIPGPSGVLVLAGSGAFVFAFEWALRVRKTIPAGTLKTRFGDRSLRVAQLLIGVYAVSAISQPVLWITEFLPGLDGASPWSGRVIMLFALPLGVAVFLWIGSLLLLLNRRLEPAERARVVAVLIAGPLLSVGLVLPVDVTPLVTTFGFFVLMAGALRHAQLIGQRGQFMSRFLSPQVARMVDREGMQSTLSDNRQTISIVCCDLRGFTAFAAEESSDTVMNLLRHYYDAVGAATVAAEGTIKDYAGDGVLILVGAPVALEDHATRAINLALQLRTDIQAVIAAAGGSGEHLDVGIGVASGPVTVGIVGGEGRLEYAAVGTAVNLASRLCNHAGHGQIVIAESTRDLLTNDALKSGLQPQPATQLKGFDQPIISFSPG